MRIGMRYRTVVKIVYFCEKSVDMRLFIVVSWFCIVAISTNAQNITINENAEITRVMDQYAANNRMTEFVPGWRIQILATTDRVKMEKVKADFLRMYPYIPIDWVHSSPYYKLLAGAFSSKLEAARILHTVKKDYPSAFPAQDKKIRPGELVGLRYNY